MKPTFFAYIIDNESVLVTSSDTPSKFEITNIDLNKHLKTPIHFSDVFYQYDGIARLSPVIDDDSATSDQIDFAINKEMAINFGLISETAVDDHDLTSVRIYNGIGCHDNGSNTHRFVAFRELVANASYKTSSLLSQSIQHLRWQTNHKFCCRCGEATVIHKTVSAIICSHCKYRQYEQAQPCVITAITRKIMGKTHILLANHHRHNRTQPTPLMYGLIAGFVEVGESIEHAIHREVLEEVGLKVNNLQYISSQPWPYPSNLMLGFIVDYDRGDIVLQQDELADAQFFAIDDLPHIPPKGSIARHLIEMIQNSNLENSHLKNNKLEG